MVTVNYSYYAMIIPYIYYHIRYYILLLLIIIIIFIIISVLRTRPRTRSTWSPRRRSEQLPEKEALRRPLLRQL